MALEHDSPQLGPLVIEAGRKEGKRAKREKAMRGLYDTLAAPLATALTAGLKRVDTTALSKSLVRAASQQHALQQSTALARKAVAGQAYNAIRPAVDPHRAAIDQANADGWAHASAYGMAEAQATPEQGGAPVAAKVAGLTAAALLTLPPNVAEASTGGWTDLELQTVAMGAALAAGDGADVDTAVRAVKASLVDTDRATRAYADLLHQAVTSAFISTTLSQTPGSWFAWVTAADPCPECEDAEIEGPYSSTALPDGPPLHFNCRCYLEAVPAQELVDA
jgi:hypothetical protein